MKGSRDVAYEPDGRHIRDAKQQAYDRAGDSAKKRLVDTYREPFLAAIPPCPACGRPIQWGLVNGARQYATPDANTRTRCGTTGTNG